MKKFILLVAFSLCSSFAIQKELGGLFNELISKDDIKGRKVIAVMPFKVGENISADAGRTCSEFAVVSLASSEKYKVVEREEFAKLLTEQELALTDLVDEEKQLELGKILVAERLVVGSVTESFGQRMINARILNVETGEVVSTASTTVGPAAMDDFMKELLGEKGQFSATFFRSALVPGWGQLYTNHPVRGSVSFVAFVGVVGYTVFSWFQTLDAKKTHQDNLNWWDSGARDSTFNAEADRISQNTGQNRDVVYDEVREEYLTEKDVIYQDYSDKFDYTMIWIGISGGVWALNLVDASIAGISAKKKFNLYFSAIPQQHAELKLVYRF